MGIEAKIKKACSDSNIKPLTGDCASVASALVEEFNGEFVCLYADSNHSNEYLPAHVVANIDGTLYDGSGKVTKDTLFEIHLLMNGYGNKKENIESYFSKEKPPDFMINESKKQQIKNKL